MTILIYGATGFTGKLCAREAVRRKVPVVLAGRSAEKLSEIGQKTGLETRVLDLADTAMLESTLQDISTVLHIAGPFSATAEPMVQACLRTGTHYLDITGEIAVFEAHAALDGAARDAGIMIMSGVGFDVVPTDCMAAYVKGLLPDATELTLGITGMGTLTRGTAKSGVEGIRFGTRVRRDGKITEMSEPQLTELDFGDGPRAAIGMSWGDVATAWYSTDIPNISVFFEATPQFERVAKLGKFARRLLGTKLMQGILKRQMDKIPEGPTIEQMQTGQMNVVAIATNAAGKKVSATLQTPEGYSFTAVMALEIARRSSSGEAKPGYQTPSLVFGADFVMEFDGVSRSGPS